MPAKKKSTPTKTARKSTAKVKKSSKASPPETEETAAAANPAEDEGDQEQKGGRAEALRSLANRSKQMPSVFKLHNKKQAPVVFTLDDVKALLESRKNESKPKVAKAEPSKAPAAKKAPATKKAPAPEPAPTPEKRVLGKASLSDILGFSPGTKAQPSRNSRGEVPAKFRKYFDLLTDLRRHVLDELDEHTKETLKRSAQEDAGDLASFSSHMGDNGTDTFDRDFALSLVSNEQEALAEIEAALDRIFKGTYGVCEITGKPIAAERLEAVPVEEAVPGSLRDRQQHEHAVDQERGQQEQPDRQVRAAAAGPVTARTGGGGGRHGCVPSGTG